MAERFTSKYGMVPCILFDGVDLLAKENKKCFIDLLVMQKCLPITGFFVL